MSTDKILNAEDIVDAIIELRDMRNWTNYKVAVECDLPASTVSNIFNKKAMRNLKLYWQFAEGLV